MTVLEWMSRNNDLTITILIIGLYGIYKVVQAARHR